MPKFSITLAPRSGPTGDVHDWLGLLRQREKLMLCRIRVVATIVCVKEAPLLLICRAFKEHFSQSSGDFRDDAAG